MHKRIKTIEESIVSMVEGQLGDLKCVDTEELGEAIDMIKDLEEAKYYCSIVKAMEKAEEEEKLKEKFGMSQGRRYYHERYMPPMMEYPYERDMDRHMGRMYYSERQPRNSQGEFTDYNNRYYGDGSSGRGSSSNGNNGSGSGNSGGGTRYYTEREMPFNLRDSREGRSPMSRKMYMESKELHKDKHDKMKDLEKYMKELSEDIVEMIEDASPEEKQMLEKKMTQLASKIAQLNV